MQATNGIFAKTVSRCHLVKAQHATSFETGSTSVYIYSIGVGGVQGLVHLVTKICSSVCKKKKKERNGSKKKHNSKFSRIVTPTPVTTKPRLFRIVVTSTILQLYDYSHSFHLLVEIVPSLVRPRAPFLPKQSRQKSPNEQTNNHFKTRKTNQSWINRTRKQSHTE